MNDLKLITMVGDETWFWVWNDNTATWEAFYEVADIPAKRLPANDTPHHEEVLALMRLRVCSFT